MRSLSMIPAARPRAALTALGAVCALLIGLANPAAAASQVTTTGENRLGEVFGTHEGRTVSPRAGLIGVDTDGDGSTDAWAYCIDLATRLVADTYTEGSWDAATVPELGRIAWVLHRYPAAPETSTETAMAVQAAIWHFSDGFELTIGPGGNSEAVEDLYAFIVAKATTMPEPGPTLSVTPVVLETGTGTGTGLVYDVYSTAPGPVTLSLREAPVDATIRGVRDDGSCDLGDPPIDELELVEGAGQICLYAPGPGGPATLTAMVAQATAIGRVFSRPSSQKLVFAGGGTVAATATATVRWAESAITTTTTSTTNVPTPPPPVTAAPVPSSAPAVTVPGAAEVPAASPPVQSDTLPHTGFGVPRAVLLALGLLLTGFGLVIIGRGGRPS